jgi:hypothetical protein
MLLFSDDNDIIDGSIYIYVGTLQGRPIQCKSRSPPHDHAVVVPRRPSHADDLRQRDNTEQY